MFGGLLPWTGYLQLIVGIVGEIGIFLMVNGGGEGCGGVRGDEIWRDGVLIGLLGVYGWLFWGDVGERVKETLGYGEKGKEKEV